MLKKRLLAANEYIYKKIIQNTVRSEVKLAITHLLLILHVCMAFVLTHRKAISWALVLAKHLTENKNLMKFQLV